MTVHKAVTRERNYDNTYEYSLIKTSSIVNKKRFIRVIIMLNGQCHLLSLSLSLSATKKTLSNSVTYQGALSFHSFQLIYQ